MIRMTRAKLAGLGLATLACSAVLTVGAVASGDGSEQPTLRISITDENRDARAQPAQQLSQAGDRDCPKGEQAGGETPAQPSPAEEDV